MTEMKSYAPGMFCWFELATPDQDGAKQFYTALFGWTANDMPIGEGMTYSMLLKNGKEVGALFQMGPQMQGIPPHWGSYVSVASADESAKKAEALGGKVMAPPFDVMDVGRMAVLQDPTGAVLSIWEAKKHHGASLLGEPGAVGWNELATRDVDAARAFYTGLFGWSAEVSQMEGITYTTFKQGEVPQGGMMGMTAEWGEIPPHWSVYFSVEDCDATVAKATSLGATVMVPPTDVPGVGRFAIVRDPQGAVFATIKFAAK